MKIYVFNLTEEWTPVGSEAIVARTKEEAIELYGLSSQEYTLEEFDIEHGLVLTADGYDDTTMYARKPV